MDFKSQIRMTCVTALFFSASATAATIDFQLNAPSGGSVTFAGGSGKLIGNNIDVGAIVGIGTPSNSGTSLVCDKCKLRFDTGNHGGSWNFAGGGSIDIKGGIPAIGITATNTVLLSGTFASAAVHDIGGGLFNFKIVVGDTFDTKHPDLLAYLGMPASGYIGTLNISFSTKKANVSSGGSFNSDTIFSGNIANTVVPVPAAVWLFGSGLIGLIGIARRKART